MALPPDIEAKLAACEARTKQLARRAEVLTRSIDDLIDSVESGEFAWEDESWDDPSVVRHTEELKQTADRARRESGSNAVLRLRPATNGR
jgi:hypothetical protein